MLGGLGVIAARQQRLCELAAIFRSVGHIQPARGVALFALRVRVLRTRLRLRRALGWLRRSGMTATHT